MFTVGEAFDLLFGSPDASPGRIGFNDRRWFRRPRPHDLTDDQLNKSERDAQRGELILLEKIDACLGQWRERHDERNKSGTERISERDPGLTANISSNLRANRDLPPRMPYDVFAIAAYLIEASGVYHHIQPAKS